MTTKSFGAELPSLALSVVIVAAAAALSQHASLGHTLRQPPGGHLSRSWGLARHLHGDHR